MKRLLLGLALLLLAPLLAPAHAQAPANCGVNFNPAIGINCLNIRQPTYSAISRALVPAASATDIFCISGSTTKNIIISRIEISGTAGTLVNAPFTLLRRVSLDTGGTAATGTALPAASPHNTGNATSTAVLTAYTANPTIVDSSPLYFRSTWLALPTTAAGTVQNSVIWFFGSEVEAFDQHLDILKNTSQQVCVNLNAVSVSSGVLDISIQWTEQ
jgi:hypothetical protein